MLILTRRVGETLMIGDEKDIAVHREEIYERIKREQDSATTGTAQPQSET